MSIYKPGNSDFDKRDAGKLSQLGRYVAMAWRGVISRRRNRQEASAHPSALSPNTSPNGSSPDFSDGSSLGSATSRPPSSPETQAQSEGWEIWETARFVIVRLQMPGLQASTPQDLKLRVKGNAVLFISGRSKAPGRTHADAFEKHIELPASVVREIAEVTVAADQALVTVILAKDGEPLPPHG